jgi:hypothetical protein
LENNRNYVVIRIAASELTDQKKMAQYFSRIAREVLGKNQAKALKEDQSWYQYPEYD